MSTISTSSEVSSPLQLAIRDAVQQGLSTRPLSLSPWLFYDEHGSDLFEQITQLPEYYVTRTERALFQQHAAEIIERAAATEQLTVAELGAGTATKSGVLLAALAARQGSAVYQPIDVSESALAEAERALSHVVPSIRVESLVANYTAGPLTLRRPAGCRLLVLYIGSSIGNFEPPEATEVLKNLRSALCPGDTLLLGTDLAPGPHKSVQALIAAYDDQAGVTAAFNRNILVRLNRDLGTDFRPDAFAHEARWNAAESRIEMHLRSLRPQRVHIPGAGEASPWSLDVASGETIHTENSYKFTLPSTDALLRAAGYATRHVWQDDEARFAVTLAAAV